MLNTITNGIISNFSNLISMKKGETIPSLKKLNFKDSLIINNIIINKPLNTIE